jgi:hypothetical protein
MIPNIDEALFPIVRIGYGSTLELDEISQFGAALLRIFQGRGPMVTVADISLLRPAQVSALHRKRVAEEADKLAERGAFIAEAVIIGNPIVRALYVGYTWARKKKTHPSEAFGDPITALAWARDHVHRFEERTARARPPSR